MTVGEGQRERQNKKEAATDKSGIRHECFRGELILKVGEGGTEGTDEVDQCARGRHRERQTVTKTKPRAKTAIYR